MSCLTPCSIRREAEDLPHHTPSRPFFGFLTSLNSLIDLAAMGLIGQKGLFSQMSTLCGFG